jgi:hypothetical protein
LPPLLQPLHHLLTARASRPHPRLPPPHTPLPTPPSPSYADRIQSAALGVIAEGKYRTRDLGGTAGTSDFVKAVIDKL